MASVHFRELETSGYLGYSTGVSLSDNCAIELVASEIPLDEAETLAEYDRVNDDEFFNEMYPADKIFEALEKAVELHKKGWNVKLVVQCNEKGGKSHAHFTIESRPELKEVSVGIGAVFKKSSAKD